METKTPRQMSIARIDDLCYWIRRYCPEYNDGRLDTMTNDEILKLYRKAQSEISAW